MKNSSELWTHQLAADQKRWESIDSSDVGMLLSGFTEISSKIGYRFEVLGTLGEFPLILLRPKELVVGPRVLVAAGFHGEEPAGCWGALTFLQERIETLNLGVSMSVLPIINPTGIKNRRRRNDWGENPNDGYCHDDGPPSKEGRILLDNLSLLCELGKDGFLTLHEDKDVERFYVYGYENHDEPGEFTKMLRDTLSLCFEQQPDGFIEGDAISEGMIFNDHDGSFEDLLFHEGVIHTACTETPGLMSFASRVIANVELIDAFVRYHVVK